jgi:hypothetical protein
VARGESPKDRPTLPGAAIFAAFGAFCLCAITGVALTTRECAAAVQPPPVTPEPFVGTIAAFHALSWRDTERLRASPGAVPPPDAARARALLEGALTARGYLPAASAGLAPLVSLPADFEVPTMEGSCGVLVVVPEGSGTLARAEVAGVSGPGRFEAHDPSAMAVPLCGNQRVHVEGSGRAAGHVWHYPGLTREIVEATGLPVDVALAHAEAEVLLRGRGLQADGQVVVLEAGPGPTRVSIPLTRTAGSGCLFFVVVAVGAGDPVGSWSPTDAAADRALVGAARCATRTDAMPTLQVPSGTARFYARPFRAHGGTPPAGVTIGAVEVVAEPDLALPPPLVEAPMP